MVKRELQEEEEEKSETFMADSDRDTGDSLSKDFAK